MPDRFKDRLAKLVEADPNIDIMFATTSSSARALKPMILTSIDESPKNTAINFRLDDDDGLSQNYISHLRAVATGAPQTTHLCFPRTIVGFPKEAGETAGYALPQSSFLLAHGLAVVRGPKFLKNPFQMMHGQVWRRWPVLSTPTFVSGIGCHHPVNNTIERQDKNLAQLRQLIRSRRYRDENNEALLNEVFETEFLFLTPDKL